MDKEKFVAYLESKRKEMVAGAMSQEDSAVAVRSYDRAAILDALLIEINSGDFDANSGI